MAPLPQPLVVIQQALNYLQAELEKHKSSVLGFAKKMEADVTTLGAGVKKIAAAVTTIAQRLDAVEQAVNELRAQGPVYSATPSGARVAQHVASAERGIASGLAQAIPTAQRVDRKVKTAGESVIDVEAVAKTDEEAAAFFGEDADA